MRPDAVADADRIEPVRAAGEVYELYTMYSYSGLVRFPWVTRRARPQFRQLRGDGDPTRASQRTRSATFSIYRYAVTCTKRYLRVLWLSNALRRKLPPEQKTKDACEVLRFALINAY